MDYHAHLLDCQNRSDFHMGTLLGHVVPGTFFILFAIWWGFSIAIKHHQIRKSRLPSLYHSHTTFSCFCSSYSRQLPLESYLKLICAILGMFGEFLTGFTHFYSETLKRKAWAFGENNAQHITMFFAFALASILEILVHRKYSLPNGIEFLANIFAFAVEGFLFHFHLHGRNEIDILVHSLLVYAIVFCIISALWEYNRPNQILATYARIAGTFLQGVWFYAIGLILYFPSKDPYWIWTSSRGDMLLITVIFLWCALGVCIFLFVQSTCLWYFLQRSDLNNDNEISSEENDANELQFEQE